MAAVLLNLNPNSSSAELLQQLLHHSVKQVINPESLPLNHRLATPNMVVALPDPNSTLTGQSSRGKTLFKWLNTVACSAMSVIVWFAAQETFLTFIAVNI